MHRYLVVFFYPHLPSLHEFLVQKQAEKIFAYLSVLNRVASGLLEEPCWLRKSFLAQSNQQKLLPPRQATNSLTYKYNLCKNQPIAIKHTQLQKLPYKLCYFKMEYFYLTLYISILRITIISSQKSFVICESECLSIRSGQMTEENYYSTKPQKWILEKKY